jgi:NAD(P)-dependent dehydrogenase (short-subunit alcohol dehydrogenase family)
MLMPEARKAIVTGGQQGIGAATAVALARAGADVVINYHTDLSAAEEVARAVRAHGVKAELVWGDVSTAHGASALVMEGAERLGGLDILVNNAGIFPFSEVLDVTEEEWDRVLATNLKGVFFGSQTACRIMSAAGSGGTIINMSSITANGLAISPHYAASKGAVISLTRSLAMAFAPHNIRVNGIAPGLIDTAQPRANINQEQMDHVAGTMIPLGRVGSVEDVAEMVVFLASPRADYITGQTVHVNGGQYMQ